MGALSSLSFCFSSWDCLARNWSFLANDPFNSSVEITYKFSYNSRDNSPKRKKQTNIVMRKMMMNEICTNLLVSMLVLGWVTARKYMVL